VEITVRELAEDEALDKSWEQWQSLAGQDLVDPEAYKELRQLDKDCWRNQEE
jgi:hypothetical protein